MKTIPTNKQHFDKYNSIIDKKGNMDYMMPNL
jgi:hypothetical protein